MPTVETKGGVVAEGEKLQHQGQNADKNPSSPPRPDAVITTSSSAESAILNTMSSFSSFLQFIRPSTYNNSNTNSNISKIPITLPPVPSIAAALPYNSRRCPVCLKIFSSYHSLRTHSYQHSDSHVCSIIECKKKFASHAKLVEHMERQHSTTRYQKVNIPISNDSSTPVTSAEKSAEKRIAVKRKSRSAEKPTSASKRDRPPFIHFVAAHRAKVSCLYPDLDFGGVSQLMSEEWARCSDKTKAMYAETGEIVSRVYKRKKTEEDGVESSPPDELEYQFDIPPPPYTPYIPPPPPLVYNPPSPHLTAALVFAEVYRSALAAFEGGAEWSNVFWPLVKSTVRQVRGEEGRNYNYIQSKFSFMLPFNDVFISNILLLLFIFDIFVLLLYHISVHF